MFLNLVPTVFKFIQKNIYDKIVFLTDLINWNDKTLEDLFVFN